MRLFQSQWLVLAPLALLLLAAGPTAGQSIGINFVDNSDSGIQNGAADALGVAELAGVPSQNGHPSFEQTNWNNLARWGGTVALVDNAGAATGITATWDSPNVWRLPGEVTNTTPNNKLMKGYIDSGGVANVDSPFVFYGGPGRPMVYVRNLGAWMTAVCASSYTVVVYVDGDATAGRIGEYWLQEPGDTNDPPAAVGAVLSPRLFVRDTATFGGVFFQIPPESNSDVNAASGNYIVFTGQTADRFILRTEEWGTGTLRSPINGFQIVAVPASPSTVTLTANDTTAGEPGDTAMLTVTRTAESQVCDLAVSYSVTGDAVPGSDYETLAGTVIIPAGELSATITVTPIDDGEVEANEPLTITLLPTPAYFVGAPDSAVVDLTSDDTTATVTIQATDGAAGELAGNPGLFTVTRTGPTLFPLTVNVVVGGTATNGLDYDTILSSVIIPAGQSSTTVAVNPFEEGTTEGPETVIVTITPNDPQYVAGAQSSATVTIADNGSWANWAQSLTLYFTGYSGSETLTNFPILIVLTPSRVGNYAGFAADGADIRFRDGDANLAYEIEKWDPAGASYIWVGVPEISDPTDSITLVWNNPAAISAESPRALWSGDYMGVWHLNIADGEGLYPNSTGQGSDGTNFGAAEVPGAIGGALSFTATESDYVDTGSTEALNNWTVSVWAMSPAAPDGSASSGPVHREANYQINWNHGDANFRAGAALNVSEAWHAATTGPLEGNTWYNLVGTYDGETLRAYRNGVLVTENTTPSGNPAEEVNTLKFARHAAGANYFNGTVDEVQILRAARSADWIANQYASSSDNFIAYGGVIGNVQITASLPDATEGGADGAITISRTGGDLNAPLSIHYQIGGTATPGADYVALTPSPVTLAAGQTQAVLPVSTVQDWLPLEGPETVTVTLIDRADYDVTGVNNATVTIADADVITNWANSQRFVFGKYAGTTALTDFPVLIVLTPDRVDYADFAAGGADIRFSDGEAAQAVAHEIEQWDPNGTSLIWVKVPVLDDPRDSVVMYWNNPAAPDGQNAGGVWAPSHLSVHHFGPNGELIDSSSNDHDGTDFNSTSVAGRVGLGRGFNGTDAYVDLGASYLSTRAQFTLSGWISPNALGDRIALFGQNDAIECGFIASTNLEAWTANGGTVTTAYTPALSEWHHVALVGAPDTKHLYIDGILAVSGGTAVTDFGSSGFTVKLGARVWDDTGNFYNGLMDEVRMANTARSADWMLAEYMSMTDGLIGQSCGFPIVDGDNDGDVDQADFGGAQACFTGPGVLHGGAGCECYDTNGDGSVTAEDLAAFVECVSGPDIAADPDCLP